MTDIKTKADKVVSAYYDDQARELIRPKNRQKLLMIKFRRTLEKPSQGHSQDPCDSL